MGAIDLTGVEEAATVTVEVTLRVNVEPNTVKDLRTLAFLSRGNEQETLDALANGIEAAMNTYYEQMAKDAEGYEGMERILQGNNRP